MKNKYIVHPEIIDISKKLLVNLEQLKKPNIVATCEEEAEFYYKFLKGFLPNKNFKGFFPFSKHDATIMGWINFLSRNKIIDRYGRWLYADIGYIRGDNSNSLTNSEINKFKKELNLTNPQIIPPSDMYIAKPKINLWEFLKYNVETTLVYWAIGNFPPKTKEMQIPQILLNTKFDVIFIEGDHSGSHCIHKVAVNFVKENGYIIIREREDILNNILNYGRTVNITFEIIFYHPFAKFTILRKK